MPTMSGLRGQSTPDHQVNLPPSSFHSQALGWVGMVTGTLHGKSERGT